MPMLNIRKGDTVYVLSGKSRLPRLSSEELERLAPQEIKQAAARHPGRRGRVLRVLPTTGKVVVEGVNLAIKHTRRVGSGRGAQTQGGRIQQPLPLAVSKVMLVCPRCDRPTRPRRALHEGKRVRLCRRCNEIIDAVR